MALAGLYLPQLIANTYPDGFEAVVLRPNRQLAPFEREFYRHPTEAHGKATMYLSHELSGSRPTKTPAWAMKLRVEPREVLWS